MPDGDFHEIQLNGKQLVFLSMAATVVAVAVFLCGVMVGRGVPARAATAIDTPEQANLAPTAAVQETPPPPRRVVDNAGNMPVTAQETLTYPTFLENPEPPAETLRPPVEPAAAVPEPVVAPQPIAVVPVTVAADVTLVEPPGTGFVVQVAAVRQRAAANTIARRLSTKGYPAFVTIAGANFRVRIGKYNDRSEAESVAGRLEREEQFKPWITREQ